MPKWSIPEYRCFAFYREQGYWGREEINLLVHAYHSKFFVFLFLSFLLLSFLFILFYFLSFSMLTSGLCFSLEIPITVIFRIPLLSAQQGVLYRVYHDWYLLFYPLTTFVWCGCPCRPLTSRQWFNHHHLPVLVVPLLSTRQRRLFCLFACCDFFYLLWCVCSLSFYSSWHAPGGSNWSLLLLGGMLSQQDISPKRVWGRTQNSFFFFPLPTTRPCPLTHDPPFPILAGYRLVVPGSRVCFTFFTRRSCICRVLEIGLYILPCTFGFLWRGLFSDLPFFMTCFSWGLGLVGS